MNSTANHHPDEIARFDSLAQRWWDTQGEFRPLHLMNPVRAAYIDQHTHLNGKQVLDIGCGGGLLCEAMSKLGAHVTGIDLGESTIEVATLHALDGGDWAWIALEPVPDEASWEGVRDRLRRATARGRVTD